MCCRDCLSWYILKGARIPQPGHVMLLKRRTNCLITHSFAQACSTALQHSLQDKTGSALGFFSILTSMQPCRAQAQFGACARSKVKGVWGTE